MDFTAYAAFIAAAAMRECIPQLHDGDVIIPRYEIAKKIFIGAGVMEYPEMGYGLTTYDDIVPEYATTYDKENTKLEYTTLDDGEYYLQYYLTDVYGSRQAFDPLTFTMKDQEAYVSMQQNDAEAEDGTEETTDDAAEELADAA